ncbi:hypothetical protein DSUL_150007 [Desulfovibrionales bacterium]
MDLPVYYFLNCFVPDKKHGDVVDEIRSVLPLKIGCRVKLCIVITASDIEQIIDHIARYLFSAVVDDRSRLEYLEAELKNETYG